MCAWDLIRTRREDADRKRAHSTLRELEVGSRDQESNRCILDIDEPDLGVRVGACRFSRMDVSDRGDICVFHAQIPCFDAVLRGASSPGPSFGRMMGKKGGANSSRRRHPVMQNVP
jgi:hypothetical protein